MILHSFEIEMFNWRVYFFKANAFWDAREFKKMMKGIGMPKSEWLYIYHDIKHDRYDGGNTLTDYAEKTSVIVVARTTSLRQTYGVTSHELRHLEDRLLEYHNINDIETAGLLSGYLGGKIYPLL